MKKYTLFLLIFVMILAQTVSYAQNEKSSLKQSQGDLLLKDDQPDEMLDDEDGGENGATEDNDPLEPLNRIIFGFNQIIDGLFLKPAATLYDVAVHDTIKVGIRNAIDNIFSPITAMNHTLQGEGERAFRTVFRFVLNTTVGCLGLMDAAGGMGLEKEATTLNETFATWGIETGPYVILPVFGPSSFRDAYSRVGEFYMDPLSYAANNRHRAHNHHRQQRHILRAVYGIDGLDKRWQVHQGLKDLEKMSTDFYVGMRSAFFQRQHAIAQKVAARKAEKRAD